MNTKKFGKRLRKCAEQASYMQKLITKAHAVKEVAGLPVDTGGLMDSVAEVCERLAAAVTRYKTYRDSEKQAEKVQVKEDARRFAEKIVRETSGGGIDPEPNAGDMSFISERPIPKAPKMRAGKKGR